MKSGIPIIFMLLTGWTTVCAQPLECNYGQSPCEAYAEADAIFTGKVISITPQTTSIWQRDGDYDQVATVVIEKLYKGTARKRMVLHQLGRKSSPKLISNTRYLFYANLDRQTNKWKSGAAGERSWPGTRRTIFGIWNARAQTRTSRESPAP